MTPCLSHLVACFSSAAGSDLGMNPDGSALNPAAFQQHIRGDSNLMGQLFQVRNDGLKNLAWNYDMLLGLPFMTLLPWL